MYDARGYLDTKIPSEKQLSRCETGGEENKAAARYHQNEIGIHIYIFYTNESIQPCHLHLTTTQKLHITFATTTLKIVCETWGVENTDNNQIAIGTYKGKKTMGRVCSRISKQLQQQCMLKAMGKQMLVLFQQNGQVPSSSTSDFDVYAPPSGICREYSKIIRTNLPEISPLKS